MKYRNTERTKEKFPQSLVVTDATAYNQLVWLILKMQEEGECNRGEQGKGRK